MRQVIAGRQTVFVGASIVLCFVIGIQCAQEIPSLFSVDVQPDFLFTIRNGYISLGGGNDDGLARGGRAEFLGKIHLDRQHGPFDGQLNVFHDRALSSTSRCFGLRWESSLWIARLVRLQAQTELFKRGSRGCAAKFHSHGSQECELVQHGSERPTISQPAGLNIVVGESAKEVPIQFIRRESLDEPEIGITDFGPESIVIGRDPR